MANLLYSNVTSTNQFLTAYDGTTLAVPAGLRIVGDSKFNYQPPPGIVVTQVQVSTPVISNIGSVFKQLLTPPVQYSGNYEAAVQSTLNQIVSFLNNIVTNPSGSAVPQSRRILTSTGQLAGGGNLANDLSIGLAPVTVTGSGPKPSVDTFGRVVALSNLSPTDIPTITHDKISDWDSSVVGFRLDQLAAPTASINLNNQRIINLATPVATTDATNRFYVDTVAQGLKLKVMARLATAAALPACTYNNGTLGVGATLTGNANGALSVDGVAVASSDVILVKNQASAAQNGLYIVTAAGSAGTPFILTRHVDVDQAAEFPGAVVQVSSASPTLANSMWVCVPDNSTVTVGTTNMVFGQMNRVIDLVTPSTDFVFATAGGTQLKVSETASVVNYWNLTGSALGNPILCSALGSDTDISFQFNPKGGGQMITTGPIRILSGTAIPAGGTLGYGFKFSSTTNFGLFFGSGTPTLIAARGSFYLNSTGAPYYNTDGATAWSPLNVPIGAVLDWPCLQLPDATFVWCDGAAYSRSGYPTLFARLTATSTVTMTIAAPGVVTWTSHGLRTGMHIQLTTTGSLPTGLSPATTYWITVIDANTFKLSTSLANLIANTFITTSGTQSGTHTALCAPHGYGDGTTTFNVPDRSGVTPAGADQIGTSVVSRLGSGSNGGFLGPAALGLVSGEKNHVQTLAETASHNHSVTDPGHTHGYSDPTHAHSISQGDYATTNSGLGGTGGGASGWVSTPLATSTNAAYTSITILGNTTGITTGLNGSGTAFNVIQPTGLTYYIIKAL